MKKAFLSTLVAVFFALFVVACGNTQDDVTEGEDTVAVENVEGEEMEEAEEMTEEATDMDEAEAEEVEGEVEEEEVEADVE